MLTSNAITAGGMDEGVGCAPRVDTVTVAELAVCEL